MSVREKIKLELKTPKPRFPLFAVSLITLLLLLAIGFWGQIVIQNETRQLLASQLKTTLRTNQKSIELWMENQKRFVSTWASESDIEKNIRGLIANAQRVQYKPNTIQSSPELLALRQRLNPVVDQYNMIGFVVFDKTGTEVGARLVEPIGRRDLISRSDFVQRSLQGEVVVSVPFKGEVPLPDDKGTLRTGWPTMFASAPVRGTDGSVIGVLAFRIRPEQSFTRVLEISHFGTSGEIFAFNSKGYLISAPRSKRRLRELGLISDDPDSIAILNVQLLEGSPASNPIAEDTQNKKLPQFTKMAISALQKEAGVNTVGYLDYRGILVVGAWMWLDDYDIGLAVEQEVKEALAPLIAMRSLLFGIFVLLGLVTVIALAYRVRQIKTEEQERITLKALRQREEEYQALINNAMEAIIALDGEGRVRTLNPAMEELFGYKAEDLQGRHIRLLFPQDLADFSGINFEQDILSKKEKAYWKDQELMARRKDESIFPVELTLSTMQTEGELQYIGLMRDISERKQTQKQLEDLSRQNQLILDAAGEGIFGLNREGNITFINPSGASFLGYEPEDMVGKAQHILMQPMNEEGIPHTLQNNSAYSVFKDGQVHHVSTDFFTRKDGVSFPVEYISKPIFERETIVGSVVTFRNVSERMNADHNKKRYAEDLEKINKELSNFTSVATHDLQEPLRKVVTLSDRLLMTNQENLDAQGRDFLNRIVASVKRMQRLIVDLLDYSRTTSIEDDFTMVRVGDEVKEVLSELEIKIEQTGASINVGHLPIIEGSRFQIRQLFQNLISNALKFHQPGVSPKIEINATKGSNGSWSIVVEDQGIGFDEKYRDRIFQPFRRLHRHEEFEGSGIGLAVCEKVVTLHRGFISAESKENQGSRFTISLPEKQFKGNSNSAVSS